MLILMILLYISRVLYYRTTIYLSVFLWCVLLIILYVSWHPTLPFFDAFYHTYPHPTQPFYALFYICIVLCGIYVG